ncbi:MAG: hypothetical protein FWD84_00780 [Oscillospiraceae bacterium]|nr:hypothetical protein [Oscillospiraceae bacterium]
MNFLSNLIPKVKCGRCDRSYSGLKNTCPYCGASRSRGGKRATENGDAGARRMIQVLLILILVITGVAIAVMDLDAEPTPGGGDTPGGPGMIQTPGDGEENGYEENGGMSELPPPPTPTPQPEVTSVSIAWSGQQPGADDFTLRVGNQLELWSEIFPTDSEAEVLWEIDTPTVANITIAEDLRSVTLEARSAGQTILRVTAGDQSATVIVRVRA